MTDSFVGRTLGKYQVELKLGQGGMGKVYRGRQISLNRPVAIKVLAAQMAMDPEFVQRFQQEARVIAALLHENIVHVYDIEETKNADGDGIYFIVMEYVDGYNLRQRPDAGRAMLIAHVRTIGVALARALDYAHRQGIVHRDIKSANVMVTQEGQIKLMDFGIAKSAGGVKTATGSVLGTPEYMAPEQARSGDVTPRTDIYSLGVLLYELATGRLPFSGSDPFAIALKHISESAPRPRDLEPSVPLWLDNIIMRCLSKDPGQRFASSAELADALVQAEASIVETRLPTSFGADLTIPMAATPLPTSLPTSLPPSPTPPPPPPPPPTAAAASPYAGEKSTHVTPRGGGPFIPAGDAPTVPFDSSAPFDSSVDRLGRSQFTQGHEPLPERQTKGGIGRRVLLIALILLAVAAVAGLSWWLGQRQHHEEELSSLEAVDGKLGAASFDHISRSEALARAQAAFEDGRLKDATLALEPVLNADPDDPEALALRREIESAALQVVALDIRDEARASSSLDPRSDPQSDSRNDADTESAGDHQGGVPIHSGSSSPGKTSPEPLTPPPPAPSPHSATQLRAEALRLKDAKRFHSLRPVLNEWIATGSATPEALEWSGQIDRWIKDRESDLRDELEEHLGDLAEAVEDRDEDDLAALWGDRVDPRTLRSVNQLWQRYRKVELEIRLESADYFDRRVDFVAAIEIRGREGRRGSLKPIRQSRWQGRLVDDDGVRFTSPWSD